MRVVCTGHRARQWENELIHGDTVMKVLCTGQQAYRSAGLGLQVSRHTSRKLGSDEGLPLLRFGLHAHPSSCASLKCLPPYVSVPALLACLTQPNPQPSSASLVSAPLSPPSYTWPPFSSATLARPGMVRRVLRGSALTRMQLVG